MTESQVTSHSAAGVIVTASDAQYASKGFSAVYRHPPPHDIQPASWKVERCPFLQSPPPQHVVPRNPHRLPCLAPGLPLCHRVLSLIRPPPQPRRPSPAAGPTVRYPNPSPLPPNPHGHGRAEAGSWVVSLTIFNKKRNLPVSRCVFGRRWANSVAQALGQLRRGHDGLFGL